MFWNASQRNSLLKEARQLHSKRKGPEKANYPLDQRQEMYRQEMQLYEEYAENTPFQAISRCPFCDTVVEIPMDTIGLDGPWWWEWCPVEFAAPDACDHFQVFLGALDLHGRTPPETSNGVNPGPGVPFVIGRMLALDSVKAVLSSFNLATGDTAYIISYFSAEPLEDKDLHQEWRREFYPLRNADGETVATETKQDKWEFDIDPWINKGKLLWTDAGDGAFALHSGLPCPYSSLDGVRDSQIITADGVFLKSAPGGGESALYEKV